MVKSRDHVFRVRTGMVIFASLLLFLANQPGLTQADGIVITSLDWHPDGETIAIGYGVLIDNRRSCRSGYFFDEEVHLYNISTNVINVISRPEPACSVNSVQFSDNGQFILTSSESIEIYNLSNNERLAGLGGATLFISAYWSPNEDEILINGLAGSFIQDSNDFTQTRLIFSPPEIPGSVQFIESLWNYNGRIIATITNDTVSLSSSAYIWDAINGDILTIFSGHPATAMSGAWHPEDNIVATGYSDGLIVIWDAITGQIVRQLDGHSDAVYDLDWSPIGSQLASASKDRTVRIWDWQTSEMQVLDDSRVFTSVAYSRDGLQLAYGGQVTDATSPAISVIAHPMVIPIPSPTPSPAPPHASG